MAHVTGLALGEPVVEDRLHVPGHAHLDDIAGEMGAADQGRVARVAQGALIGAGNAYPGQFGGDAHGPGVTPAPDAGQAVPQPGVRRIHAEPHDVHRMVVAPGHGNLRAIGESETQFRRHGGRLGQSADLVVIGQRQEFNAIGMSPKDHVGGCQQAVGDRRMTMQVSVQARNSSMILATTSGRSWCRLWPQSGTTISRAPAKQWSRRRKSSSRPAKSRVTKESSPLTQRTRAVA